MNIQKKKLCSLRIGEKSKVELITELKEADMVRGVNIQYMLDRMSWGVSSAPYSKTFYAVLPDESNLSGKVVDDIYHSARVEALGRCTFEEILTFRLLYQQSPADLFHFSSPVLRDAYGKLCILWESVEQMGRRALHAGMRDSAKSHLIIYEQFVFTADE